MTVEGRTVTVLDLAGRLEGLHPDVRDEGLSAGPRRNRRSVGGGGISFRVACEGAPRGKPRTPGAVHGEASEWTAAGAVDLQPYGTQNGSRRSS